MYLEIYSSKSFRCKRFKKPTLASKSLHGHETTSSQSFAPEKLSGIQPSHNLQVTTVC